MIYTQVTFRGQYDPSQNYNQKDIVIYQNQFFFCLQSHTSTNPQYPVLNSDTVYWAVYGSNSTFPSAIDNFIPKQNIQASDISNIQTYQNLLLQTNLSPSQQDQLNTLANNLANKLLFPTDINQIQQAVQNLEMFFQSNVQGYINTMQNNFQAELNQFSFVGTYSPTTQYYQWNMVYYNGNIYLAKKNSVGQTPIGNTSDPYWVLLSNKGDKGDKGDPGTNLTYVGNWSATVSYSINQLVTYNSSAYVCIQNTSPGIDPSNNSYWNVFMSNAPIPVSSTAPTSPNLNQIWIDSTNNQVKFWNGSTWVIVGNSNSPATASTLGDVKIGSGVNVASDGTISVNIFQHLSYWI